MHEHLSDAARLKTEIRPIEELIPYANNARTHSQKQIRKIQTSLKRFGWMNPLIIDDQGNVICGHGRIEAAKLMGETTVPVINVGALSEADRRAYIIADNRIAEDGQWSKRLLRTELSGLIELGFEVELTGFSALEIDGLLTLGDDEGNDDVVHLPSAKVVPVCRLGDYWHVGQQRLIIGDARDPAVYDRLLQGERVQLIVTDPPYGCAIENNVSGLGQTRHLNFLVGAGQTSLAEFGMTVLRPALKAMAAHCSSGAIAFVFIDWRGAPYLLDAAQGVFHEVKNLIVWAKSNAGMGAFYRSAHELIYAFKVSPGKHINTFGLGGRHRTNVWQYEGANTFRAGRMEDLTDHPTVKPKKMIADAILDCSKRGGIVLDSFVGSGTTLVAAEMTGRRGRGIELDPVYGDVILKRLSEITGSEPMLDGVTPFSEVQKARSTPSSDDAS